MAIVYYILGIYLVGSICDPARKVHLGVKKAEIELSALARQCLNRRIGTQDKLEKEVEVWVKARNDAKVKIKWQFSIKDACNKFKGKYPLENCVRNSKKRLAYEFNERCI